MEMTFDAVAERAPGPKWQDRFELSWPAYRRWFINRGGEDGPSLEDCKAALRQHMPELVPLWRQLVDLAHGDPLAARFLSCWCPPPYLVGCSQAALAGPGGGVLVRNYDLSPDLNEGLILRTAWTGRDVIAAVEFLWCVSDGINAAGLAVSLAFGGRQETEKGFGMPLILRYVLETCDTVADAVAVLRRVPSHMAYNVTLLDRSGSAATLEVVAGGGATSMSLPIATNHQGNSALREHPDVTRTMERHGRLDDLLQRPDMTPDALISEFLRHPLYSTDYEHLLGTLFTAAYDVGKGTLTLHWLDESWRLGFDRFEEGTRNICLSSVKARTSPAVHVWPSFDHIGPPKAPRGCQPDWLEVASYWVAFGKSFAEVKSWPECSNVA